MTLSANPKSSNFYPFENSDELFLVNEEDCTGYLNFYGGQCPLITGRIQYNLGHLAYPRVL